MTILEVHRHHKKLRLGSHHSNAFTIRLRDVVVNGKAPSIADQEFFSQEIKHRLNQGIPNYFGEQRFGLDNSNLIAAQEWFCNGQKPHRSRKSMVMSAARSYLFNTILAERVMLHNWQTSIPGDVMENGFPTGALWGRGRLQTRDNCAAIEENFQNYKMPVILKR